MVRNLIADSSHGRYGSLVIFYQYICGHVLFTTLKQPACMMLKKLGGLLDYIMEMCIW